MYEDLPHAIVFVTGGKNLHPCYASGDTIDATYAVFKDKETAEANLYKWQGDSATPFYFVIPAAIMFDLEPLAQYKITIKDAYR